MRERDAEEQAQIDFQVTLSEARETMERGRLQGLRGAEREEEAGERAWLRTQVAAMIKQAESPDDLRALGITDQLICELGLSEAVSRLRPAPGHRAVDGFGE